MKSLAKWTVAALILVPLSTSIAYADTTTTTTASSTAIVSAQTHFVAAYEKNQQTEASLLQQAQQIQSANSAQYANYVNTVGAQVTSLYASEQALASLGFTWGKAIKGTANPSLVHQEQQFKAQLKAAITAAKKNPDKTREQKQALKKARIEITQLNRAINKLNTTIKLATRVRANTDAKYFSQNVQSLNATILGLQKDEIRVTKTWIASGQTSVTGSVYGSTTGSN